MTQGESKAVPIEGVQGRGSCDPDSFVWKSIRTCRQRQGGGGQKVPHFQCQRRIAELFD